MLCKTNNKWDYVTVHSVVNQGEPYVSTQKQAEQAIALLESWGV